MTSKQIPLSKPAWVGSLLFHFILFLVLLMLNFQQVRKPVSIERHAAGGILIKQKNDRDTSYIGEQGIEHIDQMPSKTEADILDGLVTQFTPLQPPERPGIGRKLIGSQSSDHASSEMSESFEFLAAAGVSDFGAEGIGGGSGKKRLRVFDVQAEGTKFIFVFDKSASMTERGGIPFNAAKAELLRNVNELDNEKNKFNIIFYNDEIHQWHENAMVDATKNNREDAIRFIKSEIARGGTKHLKPLLAAIEQAPDAIFFLTDGDDNDAMSPMQLNEIKRKNKKNIQINVIQFGNGKYQPPSDFLQQIAKDNNGKYTYINIQEL